MKKVLVSLAAVGLSLLATGSVHADVAFSYYAVPETGSQNNVAAGASVVYDIYLRESVTPTGQQEIVNATGGLSGAGFYVSTAQTGGTTVSAVTANTNTATGFGAQVGSNYRQTNATGARLLESANGAGFVQVSTTDGGKTYSALLGSVSLVAGAAGTNTNFTVAPYKSAPTSIGGSNSNGNTLATTPDFLTNVDLDVTNNTEQGGPPPNYTGANDTTFGSFTVSVQGTAVPEPSSMALCGLAICGGAYSAYRRRKAAVVEPAIA